MLTNIPEVKLGIIAVSRDCFIISLSERRRAAIVAAARARDWICTNAKPRWKMRRICSKPWTK